MMNLKGGILAAACFAFLASVATADTRHVPGYGFPGFGYGSYGWYPCFYQQERLPYFALYPPVYYSYPVPRTYGYSPFASLSYDGDSEPSTVVSIVIQNPYVPQAADAKPNGAVQGQGPITIKNPFVTQVGKN